MDFQLNIVIPNLYIRSRTALLSDFLQADLRERVRTGNFITFACDKLIFCGGSFNPTPQLRQHTVPRKFERFMDSGRAKWIA